MIPTPSFVAGSLVAALLFAGQAGSNSMPSSHEPSPAPLDKVAATRPAEPPAVPAEYRIGPEDVLDIVVWKNPDLTSRGVQVRPDGRITLSVINDVQAGGLTPMDLGLAITKALDKAEFRDPDVSVAVREVNSMKISVVGMVRTPNRFMLRSQLTVLDAIALAGGFVDYAKKDKIYVLRKGARLAFNYDKFIDDPTGQENFLLQPGDAVVIP